jgi:hypothetical protein
VDEWWVYARVTGNGGDERDVDAHAVALRGTTAFGIGDELLCEIGRWPAGVGGGILENSCSGYVCLVPWSSDLVAGGNAIPGIPRSTAPITPERV